MNFLLISSQKRKELLAKKKIKNLCDLCHSAVKKTTPLEKKITLCKTFFPTFVKTKSLIYDHHRL
jgi:hypothetical protein